MNGHTIAEELNSAFVKRSMNEADTRHQILDRLLHEVLAWPHSSVKLEERTHVGYLDYVLRNKAERVVLIIEAKKEGRYFELPRKKHKSS